MHVAGAFAVGLALGLAGWFSTRPVLAIPALERTNYRDHTLPTAGGLVIVLAASTMGLLTFYVILPQLNATF